MKLPRRQFSASGRGRCRAAGCLARRLSASLSVAAGAYRRRFPAGGSSDIVARLIGQWLSERLGQPFIIDNRPGAGGNIGTEVGRAARRRMATRYSWSPVECRQRDALRQAQLSISSATSRRSEHLPVSPCHAGESGGPGQDGPGVHRLCQSKSWQDQHGVGRQRARKPCGRRAIQDDGRRQHGARALSRRGAGAPDLIGGQVQVYFAIIPRPLSYIRAGKLRALAVTSATRQPCRTSRPWANLCPAMKRADGMGSSCPATSRELIGRLNNEIHAALDDPNIKARLTDLGVQIGYRVRPPSSEISARTNGEMAQGR